jgi:hypothetical protein
MVRPQPRSRDRITYVSGAQLATARVADSYDPTGGFTGRG